MALRTSIETCESALRKPEKAVPPSPRWCNFSPSDALGEIDVAVAMFVFLLNSNVSLLDGLSYRNRSDVRGYDGHKDERKRDVSS